MLIKMSKLYFATFANTNFMSTNRIIKQIEEFEMFDKIISWNETMISDFIQKHYNFIMNSVKFGMFIWKPYIILKTLEMMNENDILVYCDAGMHANKNGLPRFKEYLEYLKQDKDILVFTTTNNYIAQDYIKADAVMHYNPDFFGKTDIAIYAGIMILKKTDISVKFIKDWLNLCENYHFLDSSLSVNYKEHPNYKGNDKDNGLFNLTLSKFRDYTHMITPDEINIIINGLQVAHTNIHHSQIDWSILDNIPFQVRRDIPK